MENSQTANFTDEITASQVFATDLVDDYLWKSFYSHSYTLFFNCENCHRPFDIDGWFYQFDTVECPQCKTKYTGVFGKILMASQNLLKLESFDNQEIEIQLSTNAGVFESRQDHIILLIFSKLNDRRVRPWCWMDWTDKNVKAQYLRFQSVNVSTGCEKLSEKKSKSHVPLILFGLFSIIGLCSLFLAIAPGIQLFN